MIKTECKGCVFAELKNNIQTGCKMNRLEKLSAYKSDDGFYSSDRFCNTYRPQEWLSELSIEESNNITHAVMNEVKPRVGFFIVFDNNIDNLKQTISDIKNQTMLARYIVIVNQKVEFNNEIHKMLLDNFDFDTTEFHIVQMVVSPSVPEFLIDEAFRHAKNGWVHVCHSGQRIRKDLIELIHNRINVEMKKLVVVQPYDDNLNGFIFQSALFKFLNGNKLKIFQDESVDKSLFLEKVEEAAKRSGPETYITWGDLTNDNA
jgi:hypothetical protein